MLQLVTSSVLFLASAVSVVSGDRWAIPDTTFNSQSDFNTYWNYDYPWGTDHNGGARMSSSQVSVGGGQLSLTADFVTGQPPTHGGIPINYLSGTIYAKQTFAVTKGGGYDFRGQFLAPAARGTWPAFWLTGVNSWPPEIDLAEWKGWDNISFNTVGLGHVWQVHIVNYPDPGRFHDIDVQLHDSNGVDIQITFSLNGALQTTQIGKGMVGLPFWL
jgi:galactan endo-beta-1,3-galactanase